MCIIHHAVILGPAQVLSSLQRPPCEFLKRRQHRVCSVVQALLSRKTLLKTRSLPQSLSSQGRTNPQGVRSQQPLSWQEPGIAALSLPLSLLPLLLSQWHSDKWLRDFHRASVMGMEFQCLSLWLGDLDFYIWRRGPPQANGLLLWFAFSSKYCQSSTMYLLAVLTVCIGSDALMESIEFPWAHLML